MLIEFCGNDKKFGGSDYFLHNPYFGIYAVEGEKTFFKVANKNPEDLDAGEAERMWDELYLAARRGVTVAV